MKKKWYVIACFSLVLVFSLIEGLRGLPDGEEVFSREKCRDCHSFRGRGGATGPDLTAVADRRSEEWIRDQIRYPEKHNPDTRMPAFGHLSRREISALVRYFRE